MSLQQEFPEIADFLISFKKGLSFPQKSANGLTPQIYWRNKIVLIGKQYVYKISDSQEALGRLIICKMAKRQKLKSFVELVGIEKYSTKDLIVTREEKLEKCSALDLQLFLKDPKTTEFLAKSGIYQEAIHERNIGKKGNLIQTFDFFGNYFVKQENDILLLVNQVQEPIYSIERSALFE